MLRVEDPSFTPSLDVGETPETILSIRQNPQQKSTIDSIQTPALRSLTHPGIILDEQWYQSKVADENFNAKIHKLVLANSEFECMMSGCEFTGPFKEMIKHLRQGHNYAYLIYRYRMLSTYGIMSNKCAQCNYQFLTPIAYQQHLET